MKTINNIRVTKLIAWFGIILSLSMLGKHAIHYQVLVGSLGRVIAHAPPERDIPTEIVTSLVAGRKDADSIIKLSHASHEKSKSLHSEWLQSVELHLGEASFQMFIWVVVMATFMTILLLLRGRAMWVNPVSEKDA